MYDMANIKKLKLLGEGAPAAWEGFKAFDKAAMADGAVPKKYKELIALGVALTTQCPVLPGDPPQGGGGGRGDAAGAGRDGDGGGGAAGRRSGDARDAHPRRRGSEVGRAGRGDPHARLQALQSFRRVFGEDARDGP